MKISAESGTILPCALSRVALAISHANADFQYAFLLSSKGQALLTLARSMKKVLPSDQASSLFSPTIFLYTLEDSTTQLSLWAPGMDW
ncbi:hypothetical protein OG21DRAFT_1505789 [Imleria badia]|nr:hypothetical protein OG21DRAFT_1505789 [Imleria badia]